MKKKIAYLTIDDAPSNNFDMILKYLLKNKIPAIFFCEGRKIIKRPENIIKAIKDGFIIGNHSYDHPNFSEISIEEAESQITDTDKLIESIYVESGIERPIKVFRFPFMNIGSKDGYLNCDWNNEHVANIQAILRKLGYKQPNFENINYTWFIKAELDKCLNVDCTYDSFDWCLDENNNMFCYHDLPSVLSRIDEDVPEAGRGLNNPSSNEIIEMHSWIPIEAFIAIIEKIKSKNIIFRLPEKSP